MPELPAASLEREEFLRLRDLVLAVPVAANVAAHAVRLCGASRPEDPRSGKFVRDYVAWGAGPRGSQNLVLAAKARALAAGPHRPDRRGRPRGGPADPAPPDHRQPSGGGRLDHLGRRHRPLAERSGGMTTRATSRFLDLRALAALEHMRFTTRRRVEGTFMGYHQSRQLGGAGEFVDFREYTGGEDLRRLDWKVFARTGKAFVRLHEEETNLACTLAIDASGSMRFGAAGRRDPRGSKLEYVQYLATALSHVITRSQDHVGLAVLNGSLSQWLAPARHGLARRAACRRSSRTCKPTPACGWPAGCASCSSARAAAAC